MRSRGIEDGVAEVVRGQRGGGMKKKVKAKKVARRRKAEKVVKAKAKVKAAAAPGTPAIEPAPPRS
jgi:hypothetical protein